MTALYFTSVSQLLHEKIWNFNAFLINKVLNGKELYIHLGKKNKNSFNKNIIKTLNIYYT